MRLPGALGCPSLLLLPRGRLLPGTLRLLLGRLRLRPLFLGRLGALLRLLGGLRVLLLCRLLLRLLGALLRLLGGLRVLLRRRLTLLLCRLALVFLLLLPLRAQRAHRT